MSTWTPIRGSKKERQSEGFYLEKTRWVKNRINKHTHTHFWYLFMQFEKHSSFCFAKGRSDTAVVTASVYMLSIIKIYVSCMWYRMGKTLNQNFLNIFPINSFSFTPFIKSRWNLVKYAQPCKKAEKTTY